ncbi:MAG: RNase P modulator RnpM [Dehalococcoidia bacterium]
MKKKTKRSFRPKAQPQRSCVACREVKDKRGLVRVVRTSQGAVEIDGNGKKSGRGAYLCQKWSCWEKGLRKNRLAHALKTQIAPEDVTLLWEYAEGLKAPTSIASAQG